MNYHGMGVMTKDSKIMLKHIFPFQVCFSRVQIETQVEDID